MSRRRKVESLDVPALPINFLLTVSDRGLADYELKKLADVANARDEMIEALERFGERLGEAGIVRWFRSQDREELKRKIENSTNDVLDLAHQQIKEGQKSEEELEDLLPRPLLPPGSAHLAAALRYQKRNIAEGKCIACPEPLAHNSATFCEKHLRANRLRYKPKNAKGAPPGTVGYLYGEGFETQQGRRPGTLQSLAMNREKKSRAILAQLGLPTGSTATATEAAKAALMEHMPRNKKGALIFWELLDKANLGEIESTAKHGLLELVNAGIVQRIGKGIKGDPYLYFAADQERAKRELAEGQAIENAGRHLRGAR